MSDIEEDASVMGRENVIIERKLINVKKSSFSSPKALKFSRKAQIRNMLLQLAASDDLLDPPATKVKAEEDADSARGTSISSKSTPDPKTDPWDPPKLQLDETYLVPNAKGSKWSKAKLVQIGHNGVLLLVDLVKWEPIKTTLKFLAHAQPVDAPLPVGARVVAMATEVACTGEIAGGLRAHQLGVVAEFPTFYNNYRYLVIFDSVCWQYVRTKDVFPVYYQSACIWEILNENVRDIVRDFLSGFYVKKAEYKRGDAVKFKHNNQVIYGTVLNTDASLVICWLNKFANTIFIYKGNPHLSLSQV